MISARLRDTLRKEGWITITEAAHTYQISHATLYRLLRSNRLPHKKVSDHKISGAIRGTLVLLAEAVARLKEDA